MGVNTVILSYPRVCRFLQIFGGKPRGAMYCRLIRRGRVVLPSSTTAIVLWDDSKALVTACACCTIVMGMAVVRHCTVRGSKTVALLALVRQLVTRP